MKKRIALFAGSFDPYTNGHHDIVRKACALFDEVVVLIGVNVNKRRAFDAEAMRHAIQGAIDADGLSARAVIHSGLVADYCAEHHIHWYVRGLRNASDYSYEEGNAQVNALLNPDVETGRGQRPLLQHDPGADGFREGRERICARVCHEGIKNVAAAQAPPSPSKGLK